MRLQLQKKLELIYYYYLRHDGNLKVIKLLDSFLDIHRNEIDGSRGLLEPVLFEFARTQGSRMKDHKSYHNVISSSKKR